MKKFLTVLLALSVVFTYTVGTAFAANQYAYDVKGRVTTATQNVFTEMKKMVDDAKAGTVDVTKEAWDSTLADYEKVLEGYISARYDEIVANAAEDMTEADVYELFFTKFTEPDATYKSAPVPKTAYDMLEDFKAVEGNSAARYQFNLDKAAALEILSKVNLNNFSTTTPTSGKTYYAQALAVVEKAKQTVNNITIENDATASNVATALTAIGSVATISYEGNEAAGTEALAVVAEKLDINGYGTGSYVLSTAGKGNILDIDDEAAAATTLEAKKSVYKSEMNKKAAAYIESKVLGTAEAREAAKARRDAYITAYTYLIDSAKTYDQLKENTGVTANSDLTTEVATLPGVVDDDNVVNNIAAIAELEQYAAKLKTDSKYDADAIAAKVDEYKLDVYKMTTEWKGLTAAKNALLALESAPAIDEYDRADQIAQTEATRDNALLDYYDLEQTKVTAKYEAKIKALKDAKTADEYKTAKMMTVSLVGINNKDAVRSAIITKPAYSSETDKLAAYINLQEKNQATATNANKVDYSRFDLSEPYSKDDFWAKFYAENGARTAGEIEALYAKAQAEIDAVKTNGVLTSEKDAAEALIAALPSKITTADADAVKAAYNAAAAYAKDKGAIDYKAAGLSNEGKLTDAIRKLATAERNEVQLAFDKLPADALLTVADKSAVKEVADAKAAFNEKILDDMYQDAGSIAESEVNTEGKLKKIREKELVNVKAAINALPLHITAADKSAVEAARAAYDAFVNEYTTYDANNVYGEKYNAADAVTSAVLKDLTSAETALKVALDEVDAKEKLAIEGTHMKIYSSAAKGYIKISWKASNSDVALDGVEVYRSTKKTSGFKKISTFKKQTSKKYTTNLKKGTKYYYYVKGYKMVGDEKVYTHNSIKVARTFR